ncbi:MAG: discoidin domain-containing protein [Cyclobacteriaceae bacterium]|nr:discoidin domain-containing protein [Cyclobacteriaceae bacterium]
MYSAKFRVGEEKALIDGKLGSAGSLWNSWQGFEGNDVDVTIDLGKSQKVDSITVSFLQSQGSWVFLPTSVEYQLSADGQNFESVATFENVIDPANIEAVVKEHVASLEGVSTRYVRVIAKSVGVCPEDHPGAGEKAWVFVDEIVVR